MVEHLIVLTNILLVIVTGLDVVSDMHRDNALVAIVRSLVASRRPRRGRRRQHRQPPSANHRPTTDHPLTTDQEHRPDTPPASPHTTTPAE